MLVLSGYPGDDIFMFLEDGRSIHLKVLNLFDFNGRVGVRVGIKAPEDITILRGKVLRRQMEEESTGDD